MPPLPVSRAFVFTGAILAGGRSSRMGRDKAFLTLDNTPLVVRQAALLRELDARELLISGRPDTAYPVADARVVLDTAADSGPLAGLVACLEAATTDRMLLLAVDLPHLSANYLRTLLSTCATTDMGVVPQSPNGFEPLVALYTRAALPLARRHLADRQLSLQHLTRQLIASGFSKSLSIRKKDIPLFANWNHPDDLQA